jgi:adenylate kinase family enzyme
MRILLFGLPGSGKTTLASALKTALPSAGHLNADRVRTAFDDWDFSPAGRARQALRMRTMADDLLANQNVNYVIADFVAPTKELRAIYEPQFAIFMDTITAGRFEDTNKAWQAPDETEYQVRITEFKPIHDEVERLCNLITKHQQD